MTDTITAQTATQYPVLVYGTLRPGQGNYKYFLAGETVSEQDVRISGYAMYAFGGFPYLVDGGREVVATLVHIKPESYREVLEGLDHLEGFHAPGSIMNHYDRRLVTVEHEGVPVSAWLYVAEKGVAAEARKNLPLIESGDWLEYRGSRTSWYAKYHGMEE